MQCFWLFDRSLTVGLIMNKDMESFCMGTPSPGRDYMEYLTGCRHPASPNPWCLPSPSHWPGRGRVRGCQVARCHAIHNGCRLCVCVWQSYFSQGGFQYLQPLITFVSLTTPSPLRPPVCSDSLWLQTRVGGWDWMGSGGWRWWSAVWGSVGRLRVFPLIFWMATQG